VISSVVRIGGVALSIWSEDLYLGESDDPYEREFRDAPRELSDAPPDISVEVVAGSPSEPPGLVLFECGESWTAYADELGYRIVFWSTGTAEEPLLFRSNADTSRVVIHVGESWAKVFATERPAGASPQGDPFRYPLSQLVIMNHLAGRDALLVHSAGLEVDGAGFVFPGASRAGKSTLARLLTEAGLGDALLSDDRVILRAAAGQSGANGRFEAWGTPWPGEAGVARNVNVPLRALLFLVHDEEPSVVPLTPAAAAQRLFPVISCPWWDEAAVSATLGTIDALVASVPSFEFRFAPDQASVDLLTDRASSLSS
jgi:hypothetical protein